MEDKKLSKISFIIPTRNRPESLQKCLQSLAEQSEHVQMVTVVATGANVGGMVESFKDRLAVQYIHSDKPGQTCQRNLGIAALSNSADLVGFLDDDIILQENALLNILKLINYKYENNDKPIGVGFNIVNLPSYEDLTHKFIKQFFLLIGKGPGEVTKSGLNTIIWNLKKDIKTKWLGGGFTIWGRQILNEFKQPVERTKWATGEDLRYSYPIGKKYNLYVCASAMVTDAGQGRMLESFYTGYRRSISQLIFIDSHSEFSISAYCFSEIATISYKFMTMNMNNIRMVFGKIYASLKFTYFKFFNKNRITNLIND